MKKAAQALQAFIKNSTSSQKLFQNDGQPISLLFTLWKISKKEQTIRMWVFQWQVNPEFLFLVLQIVFYPTVLCRMDWGQNLEMCVFSPEMNPTCLQNKRRDSTRSYSPREGSKMSQRYFIVLYNIYLHFCKPCPSVSVLGTGLKVLKYLRVYPDKSLFLLELVSTNFETS